VGTDPRAALRRALAVLAIGAVALVGGAAGVPGAASAGPPDGDGQVPPNTLIEPAVLESIQQSVVGLVVVWEEQVDPLAPAPEPPVPGGPAELPVITICTGWFDSPTTIVTAGHCVDPEEGRLVLDLSGEGMESDPGPGVPYSEPTVRPEPERTVYAFQPRELPGAVITSPVVVRVDEFRPADEGDTAKLEMHGMPPAVPLSIAPGPPRLGETVTSIGFPGLNIDETDGVDIRALLSGGKTPAEVLQDSRLQPVNTSGTITARQYREGVAVHQINADLAEGISGGPTVNSRGEVLGVNSMMTVPFLGQNFNVITDTGMLREFLGHDQPAPADAAAGDSRLASGSSPLSGGLPTGWAVLLAVLGGAAVGALGTWMFTRSRPAPPSRAARVEERSTTEP
jgi:hypothetical protein